MFSNNLSSIEGVSIFAIIGLVLFFLLFVAIIIRTFRTDKKIIEDMGNIPLENNEEEKINSENKNEIN